MTSDLHNILRSETDAIVSAAMHQASGAPTIEERVYAEQIRACYLQFPIMIIGGPLGVYLLSSLHWRVADIWNLAGWVIFACAIHCVFAPLLLRAYRSDPLRDNHARYWGRWLCVLSFLAGLVWGSTAIFLYTPDSLAYQMIIFLWVYGAGAIATAAMIAYKPVYVAFVLPLIVPIIVRSGLEGDTVHIVLSLTTILCFALIDRFYLNSHNVLLEQLRLKFRNSDLASILERKNHEIEKASKAKSQFFAAANHDLRQPLHALMLFIGELKARLTDPECRKIINYMEDSLDGMRGLFNEMLDISRLDAGDIQPNLEDVPIMDTLTRLEVEFSAQMREKQLRFRVVPTAYVVRTDPGLLERMLRNLLSNALRYTLTGSVMVVCRRRGNRLQIEVRDSGIGIPQENAEAVFEEFTQLGNPERDREKGLGLGLAIVDRLSKLLGHPVTLKSMPGIGTTFIIEMDLAVSGKSKATPASESMMDDNLSGLRVLVIDDDATILTATMRLLEEWGCEVLVAESADQALMLIHQEEYTPDVIIADYRLREQKTGAQAIELISRQIHRNVSAILITGDTAPERIQEAKQSGHLLLHKPVMPMQLRELLASIKNTLQRYDPNNSDSQLVQS